MNPEPRLRPYPTRRTLLKTAATASLTVPLLAACVTSGKKDDNRNNVGTGAKTAGNPLGVKADAPLEVVVFKGGYGDDYAIKAETQYTQKYPKAKIDHKGLQKVGEAMQPRFVAGDPPDVVDNTGAGRLDIATLVGAGSGIWPTCWTRPRSTCRARRCATRCCRAWSATGRSPDRPSR
jgi:N-acetylglucosamine transport system substrate-binding protein